MVASMKGIEIANQDKTQAQKMSNGLHEELEKEKLEHRRLLECSGRSALKSLLSSRDRAGVEKSRAALELSELVKKQQSMEAARTGISPMGGLDSGDSEGASISIVSLAGELDSIRREFAMAKTNYEKGEIIRQKVMAENDSLKTALRQAGGDVTVERIASGVECGDMSRLKDELTQTLAELQTAKDRLIRVSVEAETYKKEWIALGTQREIAGIKKDETNAKCGACQQLTAASCYRRANDYVLKENYGKAVSLFEEALRLAPEHKQAHRRLGLVLSEHLQQHTEAEAHFDAARAIESRFKACVREAKASSVLEELADWKEESRHLGGMIQRMEKEKSELQKSKVKVDIDLNELKIAYKSANIGSDIHREVVSLRSEVGVLREALSKTSSLERDYGRIEALNGQLHAASLVQAKEGSRLELAINILNETLEESRLSYRNLLERRETSFQTRRIKVVALALAASFKGRHLLSEAAMSIRRWGHRTREETRGYGRERVIDQQRRFARDRLIRVMHRVDRHKFGSTIAEAKRAVATWRRLQRLHYLQAVMWVMEDGGG